jgi:hypothetical protein
MNDPLCAIPENQTGYGFMQFKVHAKKPMENNIFFMFYTLGMLQFTFFSFTMSK